MARYVDSGVGVTLVTCTLGEEGEVLVPGLEHLASDKEDRLGEHRQGELAEAMRILGVTDWRLLGGAGRYRDSGMAGTSANDREGAFWRADLLEAASELVGIIREVRPQVLVTYDDFGGYGHPDHIQAHRVAMYAVTLAAAPTFRPASSLAGENPMSLISRAIAREGAVLTDALAILFISIRSHVPSVDASSCLFLVFISLALRSSMSIIRSSVPRRHHSTSSTSIDDRG